MGKKIYSEVAIKNAIRILAGATKSGQLSEEQVNAVLTALGCDIASTPEECAATAREWSHNHLRRFFERLSFSRGYHTVDEIMTVIRDMLIAA